MKDNYSKEFFKDKYLELMERFKEVQNMYIKNRLKSENFNIARKSNLLKKECSEFILTAKVCGLCYDEVNNWIYVLSKIQKNLNM